MPARERARGHVRLALVTSLLLHGAGLAAFLAAPTQVEEGAAGEQEVVIDVELVAPPADSAEPADTLSVASMSAVASDAARAAPADAEQKPADSHSTQPTVDPTPIAPAETNEATAAANAEPVLSEVPAPEVQEPQDKRPVREQPAADSTAAPASVAAAPPAADADRTATIATAPKIGDDGAGKEIAAWQSALIRQIRRYRHAPSQLRSRDMRVLVHFQLSRDGKVEMASVAESSGETAVDRAALEMLQRASPLPAPPAAVPDAGLNLELPIIFHRRD